MYVVWDLDCLLMYQWSWCYEWILSYHQILNWISWIQSQYLYWTIILFKITNRNLIRIRSLSCPHTSPKRWNKRTRIFTRFNFNIKILCLIRPRKWPHRHIRSWHNLQQLARCLQCNWWTNIWIKRYTEHFRWRY